MRTFSVALLATTALFSQPAFAAEAADAAAEGEAIVVFGIDGYHAQAE